VETGRERVRKEGLRLLSQPVLLPNKEKVDCHFSSCHFSQAISWRSLASLSGTSYDPLDEPENQLDPNNKVKPYHHSFELEL